MKVNFAEIGAIPLEFDELREMFRDYLAPHDKIASLVKDGSLIRLKKGLLLPSAKATGDVASREVVANRLFGPSYVSLEAALSYYNIIPERVFAVRSMTTRRAKEFLTPLGWFEYVHAPEAYYAIGIRRDVRHGVGYNIATPEKALCDKIVSTTGLRLQSLGAMREYLEEDLRADMSDISDLDFEIFDRVIDLNIKRREIRYLKEVLQNERHHV